MRGSEADGGRPDADERADEHANERAGGEAAGMIGAGAATEDAQSVLDDVIAGLIGPKSEASGTYRPMLIANRPEGLTMGEALSEEIASCDAFDMSVAFVSAGAVLTLFEDFRSHGRRAGVAHGGDAPSRLITSTKNFFNDPKAFWELLHLHDVTGVDVRVWRGNDPGHTPGNGDDAIREQPFHPKGYVFARRMRDGRPYYNLYVGSSNLTSAALGVQREWNLRVSSLGEGDLVGQFREELDSQLSDSEPLTEEWIRRYEEDFKHYAPPRRELLRERESRGIEPNAMQREALRSLAELRRKGEHRAIIISATGTGKTYLAAFDVKAARPRRMLYIAQQQQILTKAMASFRRVLGCDESETGLLSGTSRQHDRRYVFATVQTMRNPEVLAQFASDEFDYVLIDEAHHAGAEGYRKVIDHFRDARFMLGMTATPERTDGFNVFELFGHNVAYEIRLQKALDEGMLCPFHYYGVAEYIGSEDGGTIGVAAGASAEEKRQLKYEIDQLATPERVRYIIDKLQEYGQFGLPVTGLVFCSRQEEARELSRLFNMQMNQQAERPYRTAAVTSTDENGRPVTPERRDEYVKRLENGELDYLFTVDLFNEGVDIPALNQIVMLRSTESSIVFTQQLGRGLRKFPHKDSVVVIDFIGNYTNNFLIPVALYGNTGDRDIARRNMQRKSIGLSSISFDPIARERVLRSLDAADWSDMKRLTDQYRILRFELGRIPMLEDVYRHDPSLPMTMASKGSNYLDFVRSREKSIGRGKQRDGRRNETFLDRLEPVSTTADAVLKMATELLLPGLRPHELVILDRLITACNAHDEAHATGATSTMDRHALEAAIRAEFPTADPSDGQFDSAIRVLDYSYFTDPNRKRFGGTPLIEATGSIYRASAWLTGELSSNRTFRDFLADTIRVGMLNCRDLLSVADGRRRAFDHAFRYGRKYSLADVMRLCGWRRENTPQNVGGYYLDKETGTMPIFVKYAASQYEDEFLNAQEMRYFSKNGRTPSSPEFQWVREGEGTDWDASHFVPLFVMRKAEAKDGKYYYVGRVKAFDHPTLTFKPAADGQGTVKVTLSTLRLAEPIDPVLYRHLIG